MRIHRCGECNGGHIVVLLPCNVVAREENADQTEVAAVDPVSSMSRVDNPKLVAVADEVRAPSSSLLLSTHLPFRRRGRASVRLQSTQYLLNQNARGRAILEVVVDHRDDLFVRATNWRLVV